MSKTEKHFVKRWEVSIMELKNHKSKKFKVTRRIPDLAISETKVLRTKKKAKQQFDEWLN